MVRPDFDGFSLEQHLQILQQQLILENASRQDHNTKIPSFAYRNHGVPEALSQSTLEGSRDLIGIASAKSITSHALQQRSEIQFIADVRKRI